MNLYGKHEKALLKVLRRKISYTIDELIKIIRIKFNYKSDYQTIAHRLGCLVRETKVIKIENKPHPNKYLLK